MHDHRETADLIRGLGRKIVTAQVDIRDFDALQGAVAGGVEQLGRLGIIVAKAGIGNGGETLDQLSEQDWNTMIDINRHAPEHTDPHSLDGIGVLRAPRPIVPFGSD